MRERWLSPAAVLAASALLLVASPPPAVAASGDLDISFGVEGKVTTRLTRDGGEAIGAVTQPDGKVVVVGGSPQYGKDPKFALARFDLDGGLDTTFAGDGRVTTDFARLGGEAAAGVAIQPDGKILAVGFLGSERNYGLSSGRNPQWALARYDTDGTLDTTFGGDGRVTTDISAKRGVSDEATAVAIQPDGRIVVAGSSCCGNSLASDFTLARYNDDGTLDSSFGIEGMVTTDFDSYYEAISSIAILGSGKIVAVGQAGYDLAVARYNHDGSLDTTFGLKGKVTTPFGGYRAEASAVAIQTDGKIVAAGTWIVGCYPGGHCPSEFALARYNIDGSLDTTFGGDGLMTGGFKGWANDVAIQTDGKIVVAGSIAGRFGVARYNTDASPDTSFGGDGRVRTFSRRSIANTVAIQTDGKIAASGMSARVALARYLAT